MDIIFKCPLCEQELEVDAEGAGTKIECPACSETITVPEESESQPAPPAQPAPPPPKHFTVPVNAAPPGALISKPMRPLEVAAKETDKRLRTKTFRHTECVEVGHDRFDEVVSAFLEKVGQPNIISITPITYSTIDSGTHQPMNDFGVIIVFRG